MKTQNSLSLLSTAAAAASRDRTEIVVVVIVVVVVVVLWIVVCSILHTTSRGRDREKGKAYSTPRASFAFFLETSFCRSFFPLRYSANKQRLSLNYSRSLLLFVVSFSSSPSLFFLFSRIKKVDSSSHSSSSSSSSSSSFSDE